jgi:hypothetical protein
VNDDLLQLGPILVILVETQRHMRVALDVANLLGVSLRREDQAFEVQDDRDRHHVGTPVRIERCEEAIP